MGARRLTEEAFIDAGLEEMIDRARRRLLPFTLHTKSDYQVGWHHKVLCKKLDDFARGKIKRLMIFMPPRHGKSELVSRRLPAFLLGINPNARVISASHTAGLASAMNRDVQRIIDSDAYRELFPATTLAGSMATGFNSNRPDGTWTRNQTEFEVVGYEGSYRCAGVGGPLAGYGGDFLLLDDPVKNAEEAESLVHRDALEAWYNTVFSSRAEKDAGILITTTRWHEDDLAGRLLNLAKSNPEADQWEVVAFPAIKEKAEIAFDPRSDGEALWPWKYPLTALKKIRAKSARDFNSLYQQRPTSEEGSEFKKEWTLKRFKQLPDLGEKKRWDNLVLSADLRFKDDKKSGDYVVIQAWGRKGSQAYFLGEARGRWGFTESVDEFVKMVDATPIGGYKALAKFVENKANGPALENVLKRKISGIILVEPEGSKRARLNAVTHLWRAGDVWLPDPSIYPEIDAIVEEWVSFGPGCAFDDRTDAMSQALKELQSEMDNSLEDLIRW